MQALWRLLYKKLAFALATVSKFLWRIELLCDCGIIMSHATFFVEMISYHNLKRGDLLTQKRKNLLLFLLITLDKSQRAYSFFHLAPSHPSFIRTSQNCVRVVLCRHSRFSTLCCIQPHILELIHQMTMIIKHPNLIFSELTDLFYSWYFARMNANPLDELVDTVSGLREEDYQQMIE